MSRACFDPREASKLWTRMSESEGGGGGGVLDSAQAILSTHPVSSQRIKNMEKWLPEALETRQASDCPAPEQWLGLGALDRLSLGSRFDGFLTITTSRFDTGSYAVSHM